MLVSSSPVTRCAQSPQWDEGQHRTSELVYCGSFAFAAPYFILCCAGFSTGCSPFRGMSPLVPPFALACLSLYPCSGVSCSCMGVSWYAFTCASFSLSGISHSRSSYCTSLGHCGLVSPIAELAGPSWDWSWAVPDLVPYMAPCSLHPINPAPIYRHSNKYLHHAKIYA